MRMSLIESDLKSRIEEEIREMAERRASEIIEDHLAKTAESPCVEKPPVRAVAPTLMEEEIIEAVKATPVRSVPPVAYETHRSVPPAYSSPPTAMYSSPPGPMYSQSAPYSSPPPPYSAPPPPYSGPPSPYSMPPRSFAPPSSHPSMPPGSMHPASLFPHSTPNYIVWPEVAEPTLRGAVEAVAPRRGNALLLALAALAVGLSGAAFAASTGHLGTTTASAAPVTRPLTQAQAQNQNYEPTTASAPQAEDPSFATPAPTLRNPNAPPVNDAPPWSRRYKGPNAQVTPATPATPAAAPAAPTEKAAAKDVKSDPKPEAPAPAAPPAPSMDQANKTAQMLREQLNSSVK